ncbi:MAG TPA: sel1 repeat family protein [Thermopetrobacter sp.]|nr:sel1 repeat family protein [Thermopetrobacter sp.]
MARLDMSIADGGLIAQGAAADVLFELGMMYSLGREVDADMVEAHKWFNLAAIRGHEKARQYRMEIAEELSREQLSEALRRARAWMGLS